MLMMCTTWITRRTIKKSLLIWFYLIKYCPVPFGFLIWPHMVSSHLIWYLLIWTSPILLDLIWSNLISFNLTLSHLIQSHQIESYLFLSDPVCTWSDPIISELICSDGIWFYKILSDFTWYILSQLIWFDFIQYHLIQPHLITGGLNWAHVV